VTQTIPSSIQPHAFVVSAVHVFASPCAAHGSDGSAAIGLPPPTIIAGEPVDPVPPAPTLPAPHAQLQGGHVVPGAQVGQAQVHVPSPPPVVAQPLPPPPQSQLQGGQAAPGAQVGQAQVQVPPPPPLPPAGGLEQSHATAGQSAFAGHAIGCTQVQPPPEASRAWQ
jgi:hypothetical protein